MSARVKPEGCRERPEVQIDWCWNVPLQKWQLEHIEHLEHTKRSAKLEYFGYSCMFANAHASTRDVKPEFFKNFYDSDRQHRNWICVPCARRLGILW